MLALVQEGVSMVTSAGYQKIEVSSVCLRSALPLPIQKCIYRLLQLPASYSPLNVAVHLVSVSCVCKKLTANTIWQL